jgi:hypothetical protein
VGYGQGGFLEVLRGLLCIFIVYRIELKSRTPNIIATVMGQIAEKVHMNRKHSTTITANGYSLLLPDGTFEDHHLFC